jgi:addiction module HigA family antidote
MNKDSMTNEIDERMVANNLEPAYLTHPGEVIKDEIEARGISQRKLAKEIGISYSQLNEVLNGKRPLNTEIAMLIAAALDIDAEPLLTMQTRYNIITMRRNSVFSRRLASISRVAAVL